jgi:hypothetical protein
MEAVTGVFRSREDACNSARELRHVGLDGERVNLVLPDTPDEIRGVRTSDTEQPGVGRAFGAVLGGTLGMVSGFELGIGMTALIPGVGPVLAVGAAAAAALGIGGAVGGAAVGTAVDVQTTEGLPADEIFFYEDALRHGRSVVIVMAKNHEDAEWIRHFLARQGAETVDAARKAWWIGLRDAEKEHYQIAGKNFEQVEGEYRSGFEAALMRDVRGRTFVAAMDTLRVRYPAVWQSHAFRSGFDRGQAYFQEKANEALQP